MKTKKILMLMVALIATTAFAACGDDDGDGGGGTSTVTKLTVRPAAISFDANGGETVIKAQAPVQVTATSNADWCTVTVGEQSGDLKITPVTVTVATNTTTYSRTATVTVTAGAESATVTVTQDEGTITPEGIPLIYTPFGGLQSLWDLDILIASIPMYNLAILHPQKDIDSRTFHTEDDKCSARREAFGQHTTSFKTAHGTNPFFVRLLNGSLKKWMSQKFFIIGKGLASLNLIILLRVTLISGGSRTSTLCTGYYGKNQRRNQELVKSSDTGKQLAFLNTPYDKSAQQQDRNGNGKEEQQ